MRRALGVAVFSVCCLGSSVSSAEMVLLGGVKDGIGSAPDPASPSADLGLALAGDGVGSSDLEDFDEGGGGAALDQYLAHTLDFTGTTAPIAGATLVYSVGWGTNFNFIGGESDGIALGFSTPGTTSFKAVSEWKRTFDECPSTDPDSDGDDDDYCPSSAPVFDLADPGIEPHPYSGQQFTWTLDLGDLPLVGGGSLDLIPFLNSHRFLDVVIGDDSGVDWIELTLYFDTDGDGVFDSDDNCLAASNGAGETPNDQCDTDLDGYGNICDADLNNDGVVGGPDYAIFSSVYGSTGSPGFDVADMNCDGVVGGPDYGLFSNSFNGPPGPSGLSCAGTTPCQSQ